MVSTGDSAGASHSLRPEESGLPLLPGMAEAEAEASLLLLWVVKGVPEQGPLELCCRKRAGVEQGRGGITALCSRPGLCASW